MSTEGVVFKAAVPPGLGAFFHGWDHPGVDEDSDGDGHLAGVDQVVEDHRGAELAFLVHIPLAVLEDHHRGWGRAIILGRDVDPVVALRSGKDRAFMAVPGDLAGRDAVFAFGVCAENVLLVAGAGGRCQQQQNH